MNSDARRALAHNLEKLMRYHGHNQAALGARAGVAQKTISNLLNANSPHSPTLDSVEAVAAAYRLQTWHLLLPELPTELLVNSSIEKVVINYTQASHEGRDLINRVSDREAAIAYQTASAENSAKVKAR